MGKPNSFFIEESYATREAYLDDVLEFAETYYPKMQLDFFEMFLVAQLWHEAKVREYVHKNKLTTVVYLGEKYHFDSNSFKNVDFDFSHPDRSDCSICGPETFLCWYRPE